MSRIRHDSVQAEQLAKRWHWFGALCSAASVVLGLGGLWWHIWAVGQHEDAIRDLNKWDSET